MRVTYPACGTEMSVARVRAEFAEHIPKLRAGTYRPENECIGRHLPHVVNCDWAAYGLFRGPLLIVEVPGVLDSVQIPAFDFAGRPFTGPVEAAPDPDHIEALGRHPTETP